MEIKSSETTVIVCNLCSRYFKTLRGMKIHRSCHDPIVKERRSLASKQVHANIDIKKRRSAKLRETNSKQEVKKRRSEAVLNALKDLTVKANIINASVLNKQSRILGLKKYFSLQGSKEKHAKNMKIVAADPKVKANMIAAQNRQDVIDAKRNKMIAICANKARAKGLLPCSERLEHKALTQDEIKIIRKNAANRQNVKLAKSLGMAKAYIEGRHRGVRSSKAMFVETTKAGRVWCRSILEQLAVKKFENDINVVSFINEPMFIPYYFENINRNYVPDFLVKFKDNTRKLIEIKPKFALKNQKVIAKHLAAVAYCNANNITFEVLTEEDLK